MLSEKEAWLEIAEKWRMAQYDDFLKRYFVIINRTSSKVYGLCPCLIELVSSHKIEWEVWDIMTNKIELFKFENTPYAWSFDEVGRDARIKFCEQQASLL